MCWLLWFRLGRCRPLFRVGTIKWWTWLLLLVLNPLAETLPMVELLIDLVDSLTVLRLVHLSLVGELHHFIILMISRFGIQLDLWIELSDPMCYGVILTLVHDWGDKLMRVDLLLCSWSFFGLVSRAGLGGELGLGKLELFIDRWGVLPERWDVRCLTFCETGRVSFGDFHWIEVNLFDCFIKVTNYYYFTHCTSI